MAPRADLSGMWRDRENRANFPLPVLGMIAPHRSEVIAPFLRVRHLPAMPIYEEVARSAGKRVLSTAVENAAKVPTIWRRLQATDAANVTRLGYR